MVSNYTGNCDIIVWSNRYYLTMLKYYWANIKLVENQQIFDILYDEMNEQRRSKILRCKNVLDKRRSLLAGVLLKYALEKEGLSYKDIEFVKSENGKPSISGTLNLHFSLTHSGEYVGCLIGEIPVGLDMESIERPVFTPGKESRMEALVHKCLSSSELEYFKNTDDKKRLFLEFWTKKESYSKAIGKGLQMDFSQIDTIKMQEKFWSEWNEDGYCVSMYKEDGNYSNLITEELQTCPFSCS